MEGWTAEGGVLGTKTEGRNIGETGLGCMQQKAEETGKEIKTR
jgi:hypothetical protein